METLYTAQLDSPIGQLTVIASDRGLVAIEWGSGGPLKKSKKAVHFESSPEKCARYVQQINEYFAGERKEFTFPLDLRGTDFQKRCWQALLEIPYGKTVSYADIASAVGSPKAFRAVGMANHHNPIPIVVPCHRVIASSGGLCGYGGGLDIKEHLLRLEGALL
jgi:O-6-methylguanine DNA methyltransferase